MHSMVWRTVRVDILCASIFCARRYSVRVDIPRDLRPKFRYIKHLLVPAYIGDE